MNLWNRKRTEPQHVQRLPAEETMPWRERLGSPRVLSQLGALGLLLVGAMLVVQLPQPRLAVHKGETATHPILSRVDFTYVDDGVTATVRSLEGWLRVPGVYRPEVRQVAALRDGLASLVGEIAKAPTLKEVPEAVSADWKVTPEMFDLLKKPLADKPETLASAQQAIAKALESLAAPFEVPIVSDEDYQRAVVRLERIRELRDKLPAGLPPEVAPVQEPAVAQISVLTAEDATPASINLKDVCTPSQTDRVERRIERVIEAPLGPIFGDKGVAVLAAALAPRVSPTLAYDKTTTENLRAEAQDAVKPVSMLLRKNATLVEAGQEISDSDIHLLEQEQKARRAALGWGQIILAWVGAAMILGLIILLQAVYTVRYQRSVSRSFPRSLMLVLLCLVVLGGAKAVAQGPGPAELFSAFLIAVAAMIITIAYTQVYALGLTWSLVFLVAMATQADLDWAITTAVGTSVAILALGEINNRTKLIQVGGLAGLAFFAARLGVGLWRFDYTGAALWKTIFPMVLGPSLLEFGVGLAAGVLVLAILPYIERAFGVVTNISLLELCDVNQPALRRLAMEAPGTYTHSLLIGSLAEEAAESIGANGLLARVGAYFHDIGKVARPRLFVENWQEGEESRQGLPPDAGPEVLMNHVKDGLEMAGRLGLPPVIKQFIAEHHGTTPVALFRSPAGNRAYSADSSSPAEAASGLRRAGAAASAAKAGHAPSMGLAPPEPPPVRYPGPKPRSAETALVMLADAVEGATRSLPERTAPKIGETVHGIVMNRLLDGQLDRSGLTLTDLHTVEETLTKTLLSVYHGRIPYGAVRRSGEAGDGGA